MRCVLQRNFHTSVRDEKSQLLAETIYQDSSREVAARLFVDRKTFSIQEAGLERLGCDGVLVPELLGMVAYLGAGKELRQALAGIKDPLAAELFAETIRGIVQAETFLYRERGFSSAGEYGRHWNEKYLNSCRYYSNLGRVTRRWEEYDGHERRGGYLFLRSKTYLLYQEAAGSYLVKGALNDSFHEMSIVMQFAKQIVACSGNMLRVPDEVCCGAMEFLPCLHGMDSFPGLPKSVLAEMLGGGQGCIHLVDLVSDSWQTLRQHLAIVESK